MGSSFEEYTIPIIWETMSKTVQMRKDGSRTHDAIDCHDFAEDDAVGGTWDI